MKSRRKTTQINVGKIGVGSDYPVSVQSMTTTKTRDTDETLGQVYELANEPHDAAQYAGPAGHRRRRERNILLRQAWLHLALTLGRQAGFRYCPARQGDLRAGPDAGRRAGARQSILGRLCLCRRRRCPVRGVSRQGC